MSNRISRLSSLLMWLSRAALVLLPPIWIWLGYERFVAPATIPQALDMMPLDLGASPSSGAAMLAAFLSVLPELGTYFALWQAQALFRLYRDGETLSPAPARRIGGIGTGLLLATGLAVAVRPAAALALSLSNPPGQRLVAMSFGSGDVALLLAAGLMVVIGWVMREAAAVAEENRRFV